MALLYNKIQSISNLGKKQMFIGMVSFFVWNTCGSRVKENEKAKNVYFKIYVVSANNLTNFISFVFLNSCALAVMKS